MAGVGVGWPPMPLICLGWLSLPKTAVIHGCCDPKFYLGRCPRNASTKAIGRRKKPKKSSMLAQSAEKFVGWSKTPT